MLLDIALPYILLGIVFSIAMNLYFSSHPEEGITVNLIEAFSMIILWPYFIYRFLKGLFGNGNGPTLGGSY